MDPSSFFPPNLTVSADDVLHGESVNFMGLGEVVGFLGLNKGTGDLVNRLFNSFVIFIYLS